MVTMVTIEAKYDLFLPAVQLHHTLALSSLTRSTRLVTITITIVYHINCHFMLSMYHNYEKTDEFRLFALLLPLCCCSILIAAVESP